MLNAFFAAASKKMPPPRQFAVVLALAWAIGAPIHAQAAPSLAATLRQGTQLLDDWQLEQAMAHAAHLLLHHPDSFDARAFAAEVMHQRGQHLEALALLGEGPLVAAAAQSTEPPADSASGFAPRFSHFLPQLRGSALYAGTFATLTTEHFRIRYQDKDLLMAHYAQDVLEAAYARIGHDLHARVSDGDEPITVEIYPSIKALAQATGLTEQEIESSGTIAVCKFHRLMVISALATSTGYAWADTLAHELTHLMVSKRSHNNVPIWLHEGIAKYYETRWRARAGEGLTAYGETLLGRASNSNTLISFARMHPSMAKLPNQHDAALAFAEVFSMVQMLVEKRGPSVMAKALQQLGAGVPFDTVLTHTFGGSIAELERKLHKTLKRRTYRTAYAEAAPLHLGPMGPAGAARAAARLPDAASALDNEAKSLLRLAELLSLQDHGAEAIDPLQRAYAKVGVKLPQLGLRLAQALYDAGEFDRAEAIAQQTTLAHADLIEAQRLYAALLLRRKQPRQAMAALRAYCLHNPFNPQVHALWAEALTGLGDDIEAARERRFTALATAPREPQARAKPRSGAALMRIVTEPWGTVRIDGSEETLMTPAWDLAIAQGQHRFDATAQRGKQTLSADASLNVAAGAPTLWRVKLQPSGHKPLSQ